MSQDSARATAPQYRAFISYSHADARIAGWLHRRLEAHRLPDSSRLAPIFIDRAELAAAPDLSAQVREALAQSAALVVVASPAARASRWVAQEIELFRELNPDRPILAALIEGEPGQAFPAALLSRGQATIEPLAADFRKGQDGQRLGLLKIAAGLSGQPLDRLVQRDAQGRQRRVMAVTAGAVLLSLILSAALVVAVRARTEAERQRAEAEGLVEFMLTDLRERLIGVGRIDVMQAVNARAFAYYSDPQDLVDFAPDSLDRRARVIELIGQDDETLGMVDKAFAKYAELHRVTATLLRKDPGNPERIFAHARSENRLALIETTRGNFALAYPRLRNAKQLLTRLPSAAPKAEWAELDSLVTGNLCAISQKITVSPGQGITHCRQAIDLAERQLAQAPQDLSIRYDLAFHYFWLGKALAAGGRRPESSQAFAESLKISEALVARDPRNMRWHEQHMELCFNLARIARDEGDRLGFARHLRLAEQDAAMLTAHDPQNRFWTEYRTRIDTLKKETIQ